MRPSESETRAVIGLWPGERGAQGRADHRRGREKQCWNTLVVRKADEYCTRALRLESGEHPRMEEFRLKPWSTHLRMYSLARSEQRRVDGRVVVNY